MAIKRASNPGAAGLGCSLPIQAETRWLWVPSQNGRAADRVQVQSLKVPGVLAGGEARGLPDYWGQGLATEAAHAVVRHAFEELGLNRIVAFYMVRNPASGRALEKIGMKREGLRRQCVRKWDRFEDVVVVAILREEWPGVSGGSQHSEKP